MHSDSMWTLCIKFRLSGSRKVKVVKINCSSLLSFLTKKVLIKKKMVYRYVELKQIYPDSSLQTNELLFLGR